MNQETILMVLLLPAWGGIFMWLFVELWDEVKNEN
jgi:hypothetical protein